MRRGPGPRRSKRSVSEQAGRTCAVRLSHSGPERKVDGCMRHVRGRQRLRRTSAGAAAKKRICLPAGRPFRQMIGCGDFAAGAPRGTVRRRSRSWRYRHDAMGGDLREGRSEERVSRTRGCLARRGSRTRTRETQDESHRIGLALGAAVHPHRVFDRGPRGERRGPALCGSRRLAVGGERRAFLPLFPQDGLLPAQQPLHQPGQQHLLRPGLLGHRAERAAAGPEGRIAQGPAIHRARRNGLAARGRRPVLRQVHAEQCPQRADEVAS